MDGVIRYLTTSYHLKTDSYQSCRRVQEVHRKSPDLKEVLRCARPIDDICKGIWDKQTTQRWYTGDYVGWRGAALRITGCPTVPLCSFDVHWVHLSFLPMCGRLLCLWTDSMSWMKRDFLYTSFELTIFLKNIPSFLFP